MTQTIMVNGEKRSIRAKNLAALVRELELEAAALVAELNGRIVPRQDYEATPLCQGDRLELVRFVGGG